MFMNRFYLLLLVFLIFYKNGECQIVDDVEWSPQGATWLYKPMGFTANFHAIKYERDTIINSSLCKIFSNTERVFFVDSLFNEYYGFDRYLNNYILHKSQDSIFWYDDDNNSFNLLFVFELNPGDLYEINPNNIDYFNCDTPISGNYAVISDTGKITISNRTFDYEDFHPFIKWSIGPRVLKNIGSLKSFLPQPDGGYSCFSTGDLFFITESLYCYYDDYRDYVVFNPFFDSEKCKIKMFSKLNVSEYNVFNDLIVYPNPAADFISIKIADNYIIRNLKIYDLSGRFLSGFTGNSNTFYVGDLISGMYVLYVELDNGKVLTTKFVKK